MNLSDDKKVLHDILVELRPPELTFRQVWDFYPSVLKTMDDLWCLRSQGTADDMDSEMAKLFDGLTEERRR